MAPGALTAHHHPKTLFLDRAGPLRKHLEDFVGGVPLCEMPLLEFHVAVFRFANIVERFIEASHSLIKRASGASGAALSLVRRLPELEDDLSRNPSMLAGLAALFEDTRHVSRLPKLLGVAGHPVFKACSPFEMSHGGVVKHLRKVMYRSDIFGQFPKVQSASKYLTATLSRKKQRAQRALADAQGPIVNDEALVVRMLFLQHFRDVVAEDTSRSFFTLPLEGLPSTGEAVSVALGQRSAIRSASARAPMLCDVDLADGAGDDGLERGANDTGACEPQRHG